jgi:AcrR family transcriptional regulator
VPPKDEDPKVRERVAARRSQILEAAYEVFATKGYRDTTVADIAQKLGIGHGTFYRYFENKNHVFETVLTTGLMRVAQSIASEDASASDTLDAYRAQVRRIGERMLDLLEKDPALPRLLFYEAMGISPELDEKIQRMWELSGTFTEAYLHNGKKRGFLRADLDVPLTGLAVNAMIFEAGRRVVRSSDPPAARQRWVDALVSLMFDGIAAFHSG